MNLAASDFYELERQLIANDLDSDLDNFATIKRRLADKEEFSPDEFARQTIYVVLAGGFSQKTAKKIHTMIMELLHTHKEGNIYDRLFSAFHNKNKISAIVKIWEKRQQIRQEYYKLKTLDDKLAYLANLPHIGKVTANHLARNLGENVFKPDVWVTRLLETYGSDLFDRLEQETSMPRGYIDVVLWKSCQNGLLLKD